MTIEGYFKDKNTSLQDINRPFEVGDKVICIKGKENTSIEEGKEYTITSLEDNSIYISLDSAGSGWLRSRFRHK